MTGPDKTTFRAKDWQIFLFNFENIPARKPTFHAVRITQPRVTKPCLLRRGRAWLQGYVIQGGPGYEALYHTH